MKTNVIMVRKLKSIEILQRTSDGMFNATYLLKQWNAVKSNPKRDLSKFWEQDNVKEFIRVLIEEESLNTPLEGYLEQVDNDVVVNRGNSPYLKTRGKYGGTWMHPILFIKFAMWLNPRFEYFVIRFVYDNLIAFRRDAGDNYKELTAAACKFPNTDYSMMAKGLNYIVFGKHYAGIRQNATEEQLSKLNYVQKYFATGVDLGTIKSFDQLMTQMRMMYNLETKKIA